MRIQLWYCVDMEKWRWSMTDEKNSSIQETGQQRNIHDAMNDIANTVEYVLECKQPV